MKEKDVRKKHGHETANCANYGLLKDFAKRMRNNPTDAESHLWNYLQGDSLGIRFRRQHIIGDYIADFACLKSKLVIELDGGYHFLPEQIISDEYRSNILNSKGFRVLRFTNEEVLRGADKVIEIIKNNI